MKHRTPYPQRREVDWSGVKSIWFSIAQILTAMAFATIVVLLYLGAAALVVVLVLFLIDRW